MICYSPYPFRSRIGLTLLAVLLSPFVVGLLMLAWMYLDAQHVQVKLKNEALEVVRGIISKRRTWLPYYSVRLTRYRQGVLERILGYGTVEVYTSGDDPEVVVEGLPDPGSVAAAINERVALAGDHGR